ncbi:MAG: adenosine monophosphate-protein transferase [Methanobacteriota archaeon]|nr:MAG: adenosine monophosphate-protein transferase [Euryarchaeota archaeon]
MEEKSHKIEVVQLPLIEGGNVIVGMTHFIKSVEDLYEAIVQTNPAMKFGIAFNEASGDRLIRTEGNDEELVNVAVEAAKKVGAGHTFYIYMKEGWPVNILDRVRNVPEVVSLIAATANPLQVVVIETGQGRGIIGVVDGGSPKGVEDSLKKQERKEFLRKVGYKL